MLEEYFSGFDVYWRCHGDRRGAGDGRHVFRPDPTRPAKKRAYECGFEPFEDARMKFDVRYYLVAILFILFDLEIAFFVPLGDYVKRRDYRRFRFLGDDDFFAGVGCRFPL